jgi:uncharacterized protein YndB with AHSA1/START domain
MWSLGRLAMRFPTETDVKIRAMNELEAVDREVGRREQDGCQVHVIIARRKYEADIADLWDALTNPQRLCLWFGQVTGDLRLGGHYRIEGNDIGTIERCDPPGHFALTWEAADQLSWLDVRLAETASGTMFALEHVVPDDQHWKRFGPGPVAVTWDLALLDLARYLHADERPNAAKIDWMESGEAEAFILASCRHWRDAHILSGSDKRMASEMAERTADAYLGEPLLD